MAFISLTSADLEPTKPVKTEVMTQIKDNEDDLDSRISELDLSGNTFWPIEFYFEGPQTVSDEKILTRITFNLRVLAIRIILVDDGTSGTLTVDVERRRSGSFASLLTALPSVSSGGGAYSVTSGTIDVATRDLQTGDLLRVNIDSAMTGNDKFVVQVEWEITA